jgi:hypothetical protein
MSSSIMVRAFGGAAETDMHLAATVCAVDEGIIAYLLQRERKRNGTTIKPLRRRNCEERKELE